MLVTGEPDLAAVGGVQLGVVPPQRPDRWRPATLGRAHDRFAHRWLPPETSKPAAGAGSVCGGAVMVCQSDHGGSRSGDRTNVTTLPSGRQSSLGSVLPDRVSEDPP